MTVVGITTHISHIKQFLMFLVQIFTSNFMSYTMERVRRRRQQVYKEKNFEIQSLTYLVYEAKRKVAEKYDLNPESPNYRPIHLPFHGLTEHLMDTLQQMHHLLGNILMQKLGRDAQHVITAERSRTKDQELFRDAFNKAEEACQADRAKAHAIPEHLSELGQNTSAHDLELLMEYRERYARVIAELLLAKELLVDLETRLRDSQYEGLRERALKDLNELGEIEVAFSNGRDVGGRRRSF